MKQSPWLTLPSVLYVLIFLAAPSPAQPPSEKNIGKVTALEGKATVLHEGRFAPQRLANGDPVFEGDMIQTDMASKIRLTLVDASVISLGEQSRLELTQLIVTPQHETYAAYFAVPVGLFRAIIKKLAPQSNFEVTTPTAIAAIRGTDFIGEVKPDSTAIVVLEGTVLISNARPMFRGLVNLTEGMGTTVTADRSPSEPTNWSAARIETLRRATAIP